MKKLKSIISSLLVFTILSSLALTSASAASTTQDTKPQGTIESGVLTSNEIIQSTLESKGIDVIITSDNKIQLANVDPESIEQANQILQSEQASTSYPTSWTHMGGYDVYSSKKIVASTKAAFAAALTNFLTSKTPSVTGIITAAVAAFGTYWYLNTSTEDVYYLARYFYREMGPGFVDANGTLYGDYQIQKVDTTTKNSNYSGGQAVTRIESSTGLVPWF